MKNDYTNFLLILMIASVSMFILLCPKKQLMNNEQFSYESQIFQQTPQYMLPPEIEELPAMSNTGNEYNKAVYIQQLNMNYDTRGDMNDLININQLPSAGSMFVYP